ncbi:VanZ family protein [Streptomyces sp. UC4497]
METESRTQRRSWGRRLVRVLVMAVGFVCMVAFAVGLAKATLVPSPMSESLTHTNLDPGSSIRVYFDQPDWLDTIKQVGGNVVLGVPFGVLLPVLFPRTRGFVRVVLMTALVMLTVEIAQGLLVTGRAFDIDDVILNAAGAFIGYLLIGRRLGRALHPRRDHWWRRTRTEAADEPEEEGAPIPAKSRRA